MAEKALDDRDKLAREAEEDLEEYIEEDYMEEVKRKRAFYE